MPDLIALSNSPPETTSAPDPIFFKTFKIWIFEFAFTEKQINGLDFLKLFENDL